MDKELLIAIEDNNDKLVKELLLSGVDINTGDRVAGYKEQRGILKSILPAKATNTSDKGFFPNDMNPLLVAVKNNNYSISRLLVGLGANLNVVGKYGITPLYLAVKNEYAEVVELLLSAGADAGIGDEEGGSVMGVALSTNNAEIISLLLEYQEIHMHTIPYDPSKEPFWTRKRKRVSWLCFFAIIILYVMFK